MRRPLFMLPTALAALAAVAALGCEDGPAQTYTPSPPDAGSIWNSGIVAPAAANGTQQYDAGYPVQSRTVLCDTDFKRQRWAWMLTQEISPPRKYAGIDLAKDDNWDGLTIEDAEAAPATPTSATGGLCQSTPQGYEGGCPSGIGFCNGSYWGNNAEVSFSWNLATHLIDQMVLNLGYTGSMQTTMYPDHTGAVHAYTVTIGDVVRRDGAPYLMNWPNSDDVNQQVTDIFNAVMATFAASAGIPFQTDTCMDDSTCTANDPTTSCQCVHEKNSTACTSGTSGKCGATNCYNDGNCLVYNDGVTTIMGFRPMVIYIEGNSGVPQPQLSTPTLIYNFFDKWEPFSNLPQIVKIDAEGPVALGTPQGANPTRNITCTQSIGLNFGDFTNNCVEVNGPAGMPNATDQVNLSKVTHSLTHDQEHWTANVIGVNQNYTSLKVANNPDIVVQDSDTPQTGDLAQDFTFDVRARGHVSNDFGYCADTVASSDCQAVYGAQSTCVAGYHGTNYCDGTGVDVHVAGPGQTYAGTEMMMIEWARLMLADMATMLGNATPTVLGDSRCVGFGAGGKPNYQITNEARAAANQPPLCTGMEGMIIPSPANPLLNAGTVTPDFTAEYGNDCGASQQYVNDYQHPNCMDPGINKDFLGYYSASLLKPGNAIAAFCVDPGPDGQQDCDNNTGYSMWQNALLHTIRVMGAGNINNIPNELQDRRYYFRWFGIAYTKYLKAFGNYATQYGTAAVRFPQDPTNPGSGLGPLYVKNTTIDLESLFFDNYTAAGEFDKFEYIDRTTIGQGQAGNTAAAPYNFIPWDFEYGCDLFGGNQRYDNWYRRMDREEIAMFQSMLTDKTHTAGQENNVNITNMFGSIVLNGNPAAGISGVYTSYLCAIGQAGDPAANCVNQAQIDTTVDPTTILVLQENAPLDPTNPSGQLVCNGNNGNADCAAAGNPNPAATICAGGHSFVNGVVQRCAVPCDFTTYPASGCASPTQTCANNVYNQAFIQSGGFFFGGDPTQSEGCIDMQMDKNVAGPVNIAGNNPQPLLSYYPGAFSRTPFAFGHSPITLAAADKHPEIGVAGAVIPNFAAGPYTASPITVVAAGGTCPSGYTADANNVFCNAALNTGMDCGVMNPPSPPGSAVCNNAPSFKPLIPWLEVQPGVGFSIPIDGEHSQWVATGQFDFTGVLETYIVDYLPYVDPIKSSCISDNTCNPGFQCDEADTHNCYTTDNSLQVAAIEGQDFLGQIFLCYDPLTWDLLHVGMYDSGQGIVDWLAAHPGGENGYGTIPSAQAACGILVIRTPYNNYINTIVSKTYGVIANVNGGTGQGRVTDVVTFDPGLIQNL